MWHHLPYHLRLIGTLVLKVSQILSGLSWTTSVEAMNALILHSRLHSWKCDFFWRWHVFTKKWQLTWHIFATLDGTCIHWDCFQKAIWMSGCDPPLLYMCRKQVNSVRIQHFLIDSVLSMIPHGTQGQRSMFFLCVLVFDRERGFCLSWSGTCQEKSFDKKQWKSSFQKIFFLFLTQASDQLTGYKTYFTMFTMA